MIESKRHNRGVSMSKRCSGRQDAEKACKEMHEDAVATIIGELPQDRWCIERRFETDEETGEVVAVVEIVNTNPAPLPPAHVEECEPALHRRLKKAGKEHRSKTGEGR